MWLYVLLFCIVQTQVQSLRLVSMHVPESVPLGQEEVQLTCKYDLEGDKLYTMKWIKDNVEFFRYTPTQHPTKQFFPLQGVDVDMERSGNGTVVIQNVVANTSGTFVCEVSADVNFHTAILQKSMAVEEMPSSSNNVERPRLFFSGKFLCALILSIMFFESRRFQTSIQAVSINREFL